MKAAVVTFLNITNLLLENDKISEFNLNLMTLDSEQLGIPETEYSSIVTMNSAEFTRICREMSQISETGNLNTIQLYLMLLYSYN